MKLSRYCEFERETVSRWGRNLVINCLPDLWIINRCVRPALARLCGMKCGSRVLLEKGIFYGNPRNLQMGSRSRLRRGAFLDAYDKITIGNNVGIAFQVAFITSTHEIDAEEGRSGKLSGKQIVVGDNVWIAARVVIGPGTEIGAGSVISAGAVVMHSVPPNSLVAGNPGRVIKRLPGRAGSTQLPEPVSAPPDAAGAEDVPGAPGGGAPEAARKTA